MTKTIMKNAYRDTKRTVTSAGQPI